MGKPIEISLVGNVRDLLGKTDDVEEALGKVSDSLDDLAKDGDRAGDKLTDSLKDAQKATKDTEASFRDMARSASSSEDDITRKLDLSNTERRKLTRETVKEVGEEAKQNAAETFSSFDGSAQSFVQGVQGTLGGLVSSLGPIGIAIGSAGALAIGLVNGALEKSDQDSQEFRQHVADLTAQFITAGVTGHRSFSDIADDVKALATQTDTSKTSLKDLKSIAQTLGEPLRNVVDAYEKGGKPLDDLLAKTEKLRKAEQARQQAAQEAAGDQNSSLGTLGQLTSEYNDKLDHVTSTLTTQRDALKEATNAQEIAAQAGLSDYQIKADLLDDIASGYDDVRTSAAQAATAESGAFDVQSYLAKVDAGKAALEQFKANLAQIRLTPAEWQNFLGLDEATQQQLASAYTSGDSALQQRIRDSLSDAGDKAGADATVKFSDSFKPAAKSDVKVKVDTGDAEAKVDKLTEDKTAKVKVDVTGEKAAASVIDDVAKARTATVHVGIDAPSGAAARDAIQRYFDAHPLTLKARVLDQYGRALT